MTSESNKPESNAPGGGDSASTVVHTSSEATQPGSPVEQDEGVPLPEILPILPLRGLVVFPQTVVPLIVGQPRSVRLIDEVAAGNRLLGLASSHDPDKELPGEDEIYQVGTIASIHRLFRAPDGTIRLLVQGLVRIKLGEYLSTEPFLKAHVEFAPETVETDIEIEALMRNLGDQFRRLGELTPNLPEELLASTIGIEDPLQLVYSVATFMRIDLKDAQEILELDSAVEKLRRLSTLLAKEIEVLELGRKIQDDAKSEIDKVQREYILREQLKAIQRELGEGDSQEAEVNEFREKIKQAGMSEEAEREATREVERLASPQPAAAEYGVIRTYLDWLTALPWNVSTDDQLDIRHARRVLDEDHYGLEDIKERILEFLAVRKLRHERADERDEAAPPTDYIRREREGVILCFVGPPGLGKTSLGASIARALGRKFTRLSLGGVRDEAEIRGHRRTYIGALPGTIIQTLRRVGTRNPVMMLDEIDKLGADFRGDPASALLEVLDPEQNAEFRDHYLDVAFDLSQVMFITTANTQIGRAHV